MKTQSEELGGTYRQAGDYLLSNVEAPECPAIGTWGQRRHKYLMEHNHSLYPALFLSGKLITHLAEICDGFKKLEEFLCDLPLEDNNAVFNLCCRLCSSYEHKAFIDGLQYGAYFMTGLFK